jgi:hypothetical protein
MESGSPGEADRFCLQSVVGEIGFVWYFRVGGCGGSADGGSDGIGFVS